MERREKGPRVGIVLRVGDDDIIVYAVIDEGGRLKTKQAGENEI